MQASMRSCNVKIVRSGVPRTPCVLAASRTNSRRTVMVASISAHPTQKRTPCWHMALVSSRQRVLCRADAGAAQPMTLVNLISALAKASSAWEKYDKDRNGTLSLKECEDIFNSEEICEAVEMVTNMHCKHYTAADLEPYFKRADGDRSGTLSRSEFLALYLAVATERVKKNPLLLAEALLGFIDKDKNGVLEGSEVKALLTILGFAPVLLMPIPGFVKIEYKAILRSLGASLEGRK